MSTEGVKELINLPNTDFRELWDRIILPEEKKKRALHQILLEFSARQKISTSEIPLHGIILLIGPPGTGKTSLAKAIASKAAEVMKGSSIKFLEVEPHSLVSSAMGKSQKSVHKLLNEVISGQASEGPLIVLLDEVETLAASRNKLSMDANPIDIHRATDAALNGLDELARQHKNLIFIATSNFENAVDEALISRADLVLEIGLPETEARFHIITDSLRVMAKYWPKINDLTKEEVKLKKLAEKIEGFDARRIRKTTLSACTYSTETAMNPEQLTFEDLERAFIEEGNK